MGTKVTLGGRTVFMSASWQEEKARVARAMRFTAALDRLAEEKAKPSPHTVLDVAEEPTPVVGHKWVDPSDRTPCFVFETMPTTGWVLMATVMAWTGHPREAVMKAVKIGLIEVAVERTSLVRRYRVLDLALVLQHIEGKLPKAKPRQKPVIKRRAKA